MCSPHRVPHRAPNETGFVKIGCGQMKQCINILQLSYTRAERLSETGNPDFASHGRVYITWL